jgi:hypothetical protein
MSPTLAAGGIANFQKETPFTVCRVYMSLASSTEVRNIVPQNLTSAWDANWIETAKSQNPFYVALPYNDVSNGHTKPEAKGIIPWFSEAYVRDGQSVLKGPWVAIRKGIKVCYAQWEDVGPFQVDHQQYVFGNERPRPNKNGDAGIDVSPAVRDYLGLSGIDFCGWRFASDSEIPLGPWKRGEQPVLSAKATIIVNQKKQLLKSSLTRNARTSVRT